MNSSKSIATDFKALLRKLTLTPIEFNSQDTKDAMDHIMKGLATPSQIGGFLTSLKLTGRDSDPDVVKACVEVLRQHSHPIDFGPGAEEIQSRIVDIVGTGGDGQDTFNVSTSAAIVAAGAGATVVKHGNKSSTSKSGSSDILSALGLNLDKVDASTVPKLVQESKFTFLFAAKFHPAWGAVAGPRKELGFSTIFNYLGPLSNPARPKNMVVGVYAKALGPVMAQTLLLLGAKKGMVVHGAEGLDEISIAGETYAWILDNGTITEHVLTPEQFGLPRHSLSLVKSGTSQENAHLLNQILDNKHSGPILDFILLNASAVLVVAGLATDYKHGVELARKAIENGSAKLELSNTVSLLDRL